MVLTAIDHNLSKAIVLPKKRNIILLFLKKRTIIFLSSKFILILVYLIKNKNRISITSLIDFVKYLQEGSTIKIVFGFSKLWQMNSEYGFSLSVRRILLRDEVKEIPEKTVNFLDESEEG